MINKLTFLVLMGTFSLSAAGTFTDWGSTILHHVADSNPVYLFDTNNDGKNDTFWISKHIIMLFIQLLYI